MQDVVVQLHPLPSPIPAEVRIRRALKVLLRDFALRASWTPVTTVTGPAPDETEGTSKEHLPERNL